jgi:hypothetical protein
MLSNSDGADQHTNMSRQIGTDEHDVPAPKMGKVYNIYMQGVNSHDQLPVVFSLTKQHGFKKWYVKIWLALIDIALANTSIY